MRFIAFTLALFLMSPVAQAACYGDDEAAAEAAIRIHSEIMVTALTCQYSQTTGANLSDIYVAFGKRNNERLRRAEQTLISYYQEKNKAGVAGLDKLRTILANEYAERIATGDPTTYCSKMEDNVAAVGQWSPSQFEQAIIRAATSSAATEPLCASTTNVAAAN